MDQRSLFWPNQVVTIPLPQVPGWLDKPKNCKKNFFLSLDLLYPLGGCTELWCVTMHLNSAVMSHRGTWGIVYMSENINESVFDASK